MGIVKNFLLQKQEEEQELYVCYLDWLEENQELFQQLEHPNPEEVIGYEE